MADVDFAKRLREAEAPPVDFAERLRGESSEADRARGRVAEAVGQQDLPRGGLRDLPARLSVAAADTLQEKIAAFKTRFPEGDLQAVPRPAATGEAGDPILVFREDPSQPFRPVDQPFLESDSAAEVVGDIVDFVGQDLGAIAGEALALAGRTPQGRGIGLIPLIARQFIGAGGGEIAQEGVETALGFGGESIEQVGERAALQGAIGAAGGVIGEKVAGPVVNAVRGRGLFSKRPGAVEAQEAAQRQLGGDLPSPVLSDSPILQKLAGQSRSLVPTLDRTLNNLEAETAQALRSAAQETAEFNPAAVESAFRRGEQKLRDAVNSRGFQTSRDLTEAGENVISGINEGIETMTTQVDRAYARLRQIEEPQFQVNELADAARSTLLKAEAAGPEGSEAANLARRILARLQEDGGVLQPRSVALSDGQQTTLSPFEQLKLFRTQAFDLKTPAPGDVARFDNRLGNELFRALDGTLSRPTNPNPRFQQLWRRANSLASRRFDQISKTFVRQTLKSDEPTALAQKLLNLESGAAADAATELRRFMPTERVEKLQSAAIGELTENPFTITERLQSARPEVLRSLFSPEQRGLIRGIGQQADRLGAAGLREVAEGQQRFATVAFNGSPNDISALRRQVLQQEGGFESPLGRAVRSGLLDRVVNNAIRLSEGQDKLTQGGVSSALAQLRNSGGLSLLAPRDIQVLQDVDKIADIVRLMPDTGASLRAATVASGLVELSGSAIGELIESMGIGRLMTNQLGRKIFFGEGRKKLTPTRTLRGAGGALSLMATDAEQLRGLASERLQPE